VDEEDEEEEYDEEEQFPAKKIKRGRTKEPKKSSPEKAKQPDLAFSLIQEVSWPEISEHFILIPRPLGLKINAEVPEGVNTHQIRLRLAYTFTEGALHELANQSGHNMAFLSSLLTTKNFDMLFDLPFPIDVIRPLNFPELHLTIIQIVGKKQPLGFEL